MPAWLTGYGGDAGYRKKLTTDHTVFTGSHSNFTKQFTITADADIGAHCDSVGNSLRVTTSNGTTLLDFGIISFSISGGLATLTIEVNVPTVSNSVDVVLYLYYKPSGSNGENKAGAIDSNTVGYWPLEEDPGGSAPQFGDWVGSNNATAYTSPTSTTGQVGNAVICNATTARYITHSNIALSGDFTISAILKFTNIFSYNCWWGNSGTNATVGLHSNGNALQLTDDSGNNWFVGATFSDGTLCQVVFTRSGTTSTAYVNGSSVGTTNAVTGTLTFNRLGSVSFEPIGLTGSIDEPSLANTPRSATWIADKYTDQFSNSTTFTKGTEEHNVFVQRLHVYPGNSGTFSVNVTAGNAILIGAVGGGSSGSDFSAVPTDTQSNTYVEIDKGHTGLTIGHTLIGAWIATNVTGGATTITIQSKADVGFTAYEISGIDVTTPVADHGVGIGNASQLVVSLTLPGAGGLYCFYGQESVNTYTSFTSNLSEYGLDLGHYDADGAIRSVSAGTYSVGINVSSGDTRTIILSVALNDTSSGGTTYNKSITDGAVSSDTGTNICVLIRSVTDGEKSGDTNVGNIVATRSITDGEKSGDTNIGNIVATRSITDGEKSGDTGTNICVLIRSVTDGSISSDTETKTLIIICQTHDGSIFSDINSFGATIYTVQLTDGVKSSDTEFGIAIFTRSTTDGQISSDTETYSLTITKTLSDGMKSGDVDTATGIFTRTIHEGAVITDIMSFGTAIYTVLLSDGMKSGDIYTKQMIVTCTIHDGSISGNTFTCNGTFTRTIHDGCSIYGYLGGHIICNTQIHDGQTISDRISVTGGAQLNIEPRVSFHIKSPCRLNFKIGSVQ